ncbi:BREX-2 system phosphatase PglZ [Brevibacterium litoralis]|uniref:BREX-2 system phosphatase PglZ n=1 Tax=Brevibacterium litoralis TaxID=3138935 RepID=UPI0032ED5F8E
MTQLADKLLRSPGEETYLLLRAVPAWSGQPVLRRPAPEGGETVDVHIITPPSHLGVLDALAHVPDGDRAVVLTDRPRDDLGDAVLYGAYGQELQVTEEWAAVPGLFEGASSVAQSLRSYSWAATALLDHAPADGWAPSRGLEVTAEHALGGLLTHLLGLPRSARIDAPMLLSELGHSEVALAWSRVEDDLAEHLITWVSDEYGAASELVLRMARSGSLVAPLAIALTMGVLWPDSADSQTDTSGRQTPDSTIDQNARSEARVRIEKFVGGLRPTEEQARAVGRLAHTVVLRLSDHDPRGELAAATLQATHLLKDLGWSAGAETSLVLHEGLTARLRRLAAAVVAGHGYEEAHRALLEHREASEVREAALAAVRLARWLETPEETTADLAADFDRHVRDGAWVDTALGYVWSTAEDPEVAQAWSTLMERVVIRRVKRSHLAATRVDQVRTWEATPDWTAVHGVEDVLAGVVAPWKSMPVKDGNGVLLIVMDGMSAAIAEQVTMEARRELGFVEWTPSELKRRIAVAAALPSLTEVSRTSMFAGRVTQGNSASERSGLASVFDGAQVFHKAGLRDAGGAALPKDVRDAIAATTEVPVVGVVVNVIDDATHKTDTSRVTWTLSTLGPLRSLLLAARDAGRTVVLTSDHGHVVERGTTTATGTAPASRWRLVDSTDDAKALPAGEVLVSGSRVCAEGATRAVLLSGEDTRYGAQAAGYHGGASLAEIVVPVSVLRASNQHACPDGWVLAPTVVPPWWNEPIVNGTGSADQSTGSKKGRSKPSTRKKKPETTDSSAPDLFGYSSADDLKALLSPKGSDDRDLAAAVRTSAVYEAQRKKVRRAGPQTNDHVESILRALLERPDGRMHRDTLAAKATLPASEVTPVLAVVRRLLNVESYPILDQDSDGTIRLDVALLREQFELSDGVGG